MHFDPRRSLLASVFLLACSSPSNTPSDASGGSSSSGGTSANGGATPQNGGATQQSGGATQQSGGSASGGSSNGNGGAQSGGSSAGGSSNGGASNGGSTNGGSASGGSSTGGSSNGGSNTGGAAKGGSTNGGSANGGSSSGGGSSGGAASGGKASGGSSSGGASGGAASGGKASGGASSGGSSTGGSTSAYRPCPTTGACKIMPFGDSITDGYGTNGAYRVELFRLAHSAGKNITFVGTGYNTPGTLVDGVTFPPNHEGHSGWTIDSIGGRTGISTLVSTVMPQFTPHIITLMIGTNDAIDNADLANAPKRLGNLLDSIYALLPNVLIVVAQPIPSQNPDTTARIQTYNAGIPAIVKARADAGKHILLVDMFTGFSVSLLKDEWHPDVAGHVIIGTRFYNALAASL
ncbi:MAG: SGNH/GDSL hydrolase family protein [Polyangiaceae bacterium]